MVQIYSWAPVFAILLALSAAFFVVVNRRNQNLREAWTLLCAWGVLIIVLGMVTSVANGVQIRFDVFEIVRGVSLGFCVDGIGITFAFVASFLWIVTSVYAVGYMRGLREHSQTRFYAFFAISIAATLGVAFSANLLTLYLFYELLSLSTYPLVTHHGDKEARDAGRKYLTYLLGSSVGLALPALVITYMVSGTLEFRPDGVFPAETAPGMLATLLVMFVFGFAKSGLMPLHSWLPGAMVAPTPVSSLLHAVAVVKVGVFSVIRVVTGIFGVEHLQELFVGGVRFHLVLAGVAAVTVLASSLIALSQDGLKRRLAFSTIGQLGYIIMGVLLLTPQAVAGSVLHIVMHAFGKITLFFCAGAIFVASGKKYISQLDGLGWRMPVTFTAFFIGAVSVVGMPPTGGFISKWYLASGAHAGQFNAFMVVYLISSFLGAAYLFPIPFRAFFRPAPAVKAGEALVQEAPLCCVVPLVVTAAMSLLLFLFPGMVIELIDATVRAMF